MLIYEEVLQLIDKIYDAAIDADRWPAFLNSASEFFNAQMNTLLLMDSSNPAASVVQLQGWNPDVVPEYLQRKDTEDYWLIGAKQLDSGTVALGTDIIDLHKMRNTCFYREVVSRLDGDYMLGGVIENKPERQAFISFLRGRDRDNFSMVEKKALATLMPHIQRAHFIHLQLRNKSSMEQALNESDYGVLLIDNRGIVVFTNRIAKQYLIDSDGMTLRYGALKLYDYADQLDLDKQINSVNTISQYNDAQRNGILRVRRPSGKLPYQVTVSPLTSQFCGTELANAASCLVFIHDPTHCPSLSRNILKTAYNLTDAEARLCELLFNGKSMNEAASDLAISRNTAKTHLMHIFDKCDVNSQPALMRLLSLGLKG